MSVVKALNLDSSAQRKFINFYTETFGNDETLSVFRVFERANGDYYSIHGKDVDTALKTSLKSSIIVKIMAPQDGTPGLKYASLNKSLFEKLLKNLLLVVGFKVEVYTTQRAGQEDWKLEFKGSPGNLSQFEDLLFNSSEPEILNNLLLSINVHQKTFGLAAIDTSERCISVAEIEDSALFTELEAAVVLLSAKECVLPSITGEYEKIREVLERNGMLVTVMKKSNFANNASLHQDLEKLVRFKKDQKKSVHTIPELKLDLAMGSVAAGLKYLEAINEESNIGKFTIKTLNLKRFVHLDSAAVSALNLFPPAGINYRSSLYKWQSVLGVLDRCKTNQGRRLLNQFLKQPLRNIDLIRERQDIIASFVDNQEVRSSLHKEHLSSLPDVLMLNNKLLRKRANLQDVFKVYQIVLRLPEILRLLNGMENSVVKSVLADSFSDVQQDLNKFEVMVEQVLDLKAVERGEYLVKHSFDETLGEIKEEMDKLEAAMRKELKKCSRISGLDEGTAIKLDYVSHLGYHFRSTRKEEAKLRNHKVFETIDTARGGIRYTTSDLKSLNADFIKLKEDYEDKQKEIVQEIVHTAAGYSAPLLCLNQAIATLDVFISLSEVVCNSPGEYVRPKMYPETERILTLKALRHPCLECQDDIEYIPNDVILKEDDTNMCIITGANISGKSTYIRSVGVAVLLSHIGSFVPCEEAHISICDSILARVGANDNLSKGLSTFMVEMVETSSILQTATKNSLVIIDELGRGTSTFEGLGLAWAIAEHLVKNVQCFSLFATHFHEITALAETEPFAKNYHLAAITDDGQLTLLFKVKPGPVDRSFGIQVAELVQLPKKVLADAKNFLLQIEQEQRKTESLSGKEAGIQEMLEEVMKGGRIDLDLINSFV